MLIALAFLGPAVATLKGIVLGIVTVVGGVLVGILGPIILVVGAVLAVVLYFILRWDEIWEGFHERNAQIAAIASAVWAGFWTH